MTEDLTPEPAEAEDLVVSEDDSAPVEATEPTVGSRRWWIPLAIVGGVLVVLLAASQVYLITTLNDTQAELSATRSELSSLEAHVADVNNAVAQIGSSLTAPNSGASAQGATPAPALPSGSLPRWERGQADPAIGMELGSITGVDAYSGSALTVDPADGTKRIWMVWAHWCPYCQEELPTLSSMYGDLKTDFPSIEIATVTTSIDPARGNPLEAYLVDEQFPFTVIQDEDLTLAAQMGVAAFPFWVVTDGDGAVLYRTAGYLDETQILNLFTSLDQFDAEA